MNKPHLFALLGASGIAAGFLRGCSAWAGPGDRSPVLATHQRRGLPAEHIVALALGTSMAAIVVSAMQSAYGHYRRGSASTIAFKQERPG